MAKCSFCNQEIEKGTGKLVISKAGRSRRFCSMKCEKNMLKLGRKSVNLKWTQNE
tara:strand:+ start:3066 stop:3230 length:165 start_codon:yes stop_codon:yes gene_type:complete